MSLRARLVAVASALVVVGLVVAAFASYAALRSSLLTRVDQQLEVFGGRVQRELIRGGDPSRAAAFDTVAGSPPFFQVRDGDQVLGTFALRLRDEPTYTPQLPSHLPGVPVDTTPGPGGPGRVLTVGAAEAGAPTFRVRISSVGGAGQVLVVALPLRDVQNTLDRFRNIELAVTGGVALAVVALSLWLVRLGLRPLTGMSKTAEAIAAGDLSRRVAPADDRTEIGRFGQALNTMLGRIESAFAERQASEDRLRRFVADASHELRTPLTSIRGYAELFRRGAATRPDDLAKAMHRIEDEAVRMGVLVEELLLLARLDQGRPVERQPVDLTALARDAVADARVVEPARPLELDADGPVRVTGDAVRLRQVLDNLLANVRTHTAPETAAAVRVRADDGHAVLEVADRGPGMSEDETARAFERFYRVDASRSRDSGGVGLGLSIVSAIVTAHGGEVRLRSAPGEGATFTVTLPLESEPPAPQE
ncbi:MAG: periplasmic sensor signal transduction histidine kinase [Acidimicrobiales bacterium]|nr:periplasmic sensor signal transduction histidine kinase [Acidimicrobiales bacterium]